MRPRPSLAPPVARNQRASASASCRDRHQRAALRRRRRRAGSGRPRRARCGYRQGRCASTGAARYRRQSRTSPAVGSAAPAASVKRGRERMRASRRRQKGVTRMLRRASVSASASISPSARSPSISAGHGRCRVTPRICRLARRGQVDQRRCHAPSASRREAPRACAGVSRPPRRAHAHHQPVARLPSARSAPGHQPLTGTARLMTRPPSVAAIELRRVAHSPAVVQRGGTAPRIAASAPGFSRGHEVARSRTGPASPRDRGRTDAAARRRARCAKAAR